ncbi:hypothetical protein N7537_007057 [Penicillium hordei]|uniref:Uncharacterized protein n=1 Tax=Penicillium hordei TaxID=40994 RepID=A0AAD6E8Y8_9EURO|nr:uncharacterized protein N7537_007057 [Penicillium hordei]KAJ5604101.1 hypothetical protein N7537_007057 [Penicillium hordei]
MTPQSVSKGFKGVGIADHIEDGCLGRTQKFRLALSKIIGCLELKLRDAQPILIGQNALDGEYILGYPPI